jgi:hypothetical protein
MLGAFYLAVRCDGAGARTRLALGAVLGLSLLHHRMIVFAVPGIALWLWTGTAAKDRLKVAGHVAAGAVLGAIPFVVLCAVASRSPPPGTADTLRWWFEDVFMGGERNAQFILDEGKKGLGTSAAYLAKWFVFNLPGPALVLGVAGFFASSRRVALFLATEAAAHVWFPLRYDWTGDQYTFLIPLYPVFGIAAGMAVARLEERRGPAAATWAAASAAAAPLALYLVLGLTPLATRVFPGLTQDAARRTLVPVRTGDRWSRDWCAERLARVPQGAVLHADWGDGQVYRYLQESEGLRRDVKVEIWIRDLVVGDGRGEEWVSVLPFTTEPPKKVARAVPRLEPRGDGLFRVKPE